MNSDTAQRTVIRVARGVARTVYQLFLTFLAGIILTGSLWLIIIARINWIVANEPSLWRLIGLHVLDLQSGYNMQYHIQRIVELFIGF